MRTAFVFLFSLLCIPITSAHGDGLSFEREVGDVLIDIGFGKDMPTIGSTLTYSFDLFNIADPEGYTFESFSKVHVRIFKGRTELLSRTIENNGVDVPFLSFNYKETGDYSMAVVYERSGKESIDATFGYRVLDPSAITTPPRPKVGQTAGVVGIILVLFALCGGAFVFRKKA